MGYDAAEQAYGEHRFAEAQALLNEHLTEQPNDPRAVLLQAYIHFYGFQDTAAAASSYRQVLELETEGPYNDLATEGLKNCPVSEREAKPAEPTVELAQTKEPTDENERPPATPWLAELKPQQEQAKQPKPEPDLELALKPQAPQQEEPQIAISYAMAEQAYQARDFTAAQQVLNALLAESPNDLRCLLLQGYVRSFGFHDEPAAISSYQRVLELEVEGPYRDLAIEGLSQCGVNLDPAPAEPMESEPKPDPADAAADLSSLAKAVAEPEEALQPEPKPKKTETTPSAKTASEQALADGWLLVDLSAQA